MDGTKYDLNESCSSNIVFLRESRFQEDYVDISPRTLTLNFEISLFLSARHYFDLQDIKISLEDVDFYAILHILGSYILT